MRGVVAVIGAMLVVLGIGWLGYMLGASANVAIVAAPAAYPVYGWGFGFPFFPFFGFIFFLLFMFIVFGLIRRAAWGGGKGPGFRRGWGGGWNGGWDHRTMPPQADAMLQGWHRRAHGEPDASPPAAPDEPR